MSDSPLEDVIRGILNHDRTVVENLYRSVFPQLKGFVLSNNGEFEDAEDVFQESFLRLYKKVQSPDLQIDTSVSQYLFSIGKYVWLKKLKKSWKNEGTFPAEKELIDEGSLVKDLERSEKESFFYEKLALLDEGCQVLLQLFFEGHSMLEIVEKLEFSSVMYARKKKYLCKEKLLVLVKKDPRYLELVNDE